MTKIELARFSDSLEKDRISHPENQTEENHGRKNQKKPSPGLVLGELVEVVIHAAIHSFQTWSHFVCGETPEWMTKGEPRTIALLVQVVVLVVDRGVQADVRSV